MELLQSLPQQLPHHHQHAMAYQTPIGLVVAVLISVTLEEEIVTMITNVMETLFVDPTIV